MTGFRPTNSNTSYNNGRPCLDNTQRVLDRPGSKEAGQFLEWQETVADSTSLNFRFIRAYSHSVNTELSDYI